MNYRQALSSLTPEIYQSFKTAVELGKWPDGRKLSAEQRQTCMEAMIAYEQTHLPPEQRTGYVPPKPGSSCGPNSADAEPSGEQPIKWR